MITLAAVLAAILLLTFAVWRTGRMFGFRLCPVCAGVSVTWLGLLTARQLGYPIDPVILAVLMGGSVAGISYQIEKRIRHNRPRIFWKTIFIGAGFATAYSVAYAWWITAAAALMIALSALTRWRALGKKREPREDQIAQELEKKMNDCC